MVEKEFKISGMTCHHCAMAVRKELENLPGVQVRNVQIGSATVVLDESKASIGKIKDAVREAGYCVVD